MSMTIELTREEESKLRELAARHGRRPEALAADVVRLQISREPFATYEDSLQMRLSEGLPVDFWTRYNDLNEKRRAYALSEDEYREYLELNQRLERWNVERLEIAAELAVLRGVSLRDLLKQQGLWQDSIT